MDYDDNPYLPANELLKSVSKDTGIPLDQLNFVATQVVAIVLAPLFRCVFHPNTTKPAIRHAFALTSGIILAYFAFGTQAIHLAGLPSICYLVMRTQDPQIMQRMVMAVALMYLSVIHVHRLIYDSGTYSMDVTGPLMVMTQKVTSLAFSLHDGTTESDEKLTPTQRRQAIRALPTLLEYFSYMLHFQSLMAGPIVFYNDYLAFIDGSALRTAQPPAAGREAVSTPPPVEPSPVYPALKKITISIICALIFTNFSPFFPIKKAKEPEFFEKSVLGQLFFLGVATMMVRFKYYHAWILADGICNLSGLGFAGYNASGEAQWDLVSNVDIIDFELGLSLRECIAHWNKGTNAWLRFVVYERVGPAHRTLLTFALSAIWHGFYPG